MIKIELKEYTNIFYILGNNFYWFSFAQFHRKILIINNIDILWWEVGKIYDFSTVIFKIYHFYWWKILITRKIKYAIVQELLEIPYCPLLYGTAK